MMALPFSIVEWALRCGRTAAAATDASAGVRVITLSDCGITLDLYAARGWERLLCRSCCRMALGRNPLKLRAASVDVS